jgi:hypothetical protein
MKSLIKRTLVKLFPRHALRYRAYQTLSGNEHSYLYSTGWMRSLEAGRPMDRTGRSIPWMNYPVIQLLEEKLTPDLHLFEFGSGHSTLFYAGKVSEVFSVEYDKSWLDIVQAQAPKNVTLVFKDKDVDGEYCRVIGSTGRQFDVIVVDGRDRVNCVKQGLAALSARGVMLLDDSERERYREAIEFVIARGFKVLNLEGLKATGEQMDRTTLIYREGNCFGL